MIVSFKEIYRKKFGKEKKIFEGCGIYYRFYLFYFSKRRRSYLKGFSAFLKKNRDIRLEQV